MEQERFVPGDPGAIWYEHWHRYHFAAGLAAGKRVLDIACGNGYGSALLAARARHVIGVDSSTEVIAQARRRYGKHANLEFLAGRCEAIPLEEGSVDMVVSFETLEHVSNAERLVEESARVLGMDGLLVLSTPNKEVYSDQRGYSNPHHVREFYQDEMVQLLGRHFPHVAFFGQRVDAFSAIWPLGRISDRCTLFDARRTEPESPDHGVSDPMYFVAVCSREPAPLAACSSMLSLLSDKDHYFMREHEAMDQRLNLMEASSKRLEAAYVASQQQLAALVAEHGRAMSALALLQKSSGGSGEGPRERQHAAAVVIRRTGAIGDCILATPLIRRIKQEAPESAIYVETAFPEVFKGNPDVAGVARSWDQLLKLYRLIDLDLAYESRPMVNIIDAYAQASGYAINDRQTRLVLTEADKAFALEALGTGKWVAMHCGPSNWPGKQWPIQRFAEVSRWLGERGYQVALVGEFLPNVPHDRQFCGGLTLQQTAAIIARCRLFIGLDSAPIHLAQSQAVPVLGLFGCTLPEIVLSRMDGVLGISADKSVACAGSRHRTSNYQPCSPDCINSIGVDRVIDVLEEFL